MIALRHRTAGLVTAVRESLPQGRTLPTDAWERRHKGILWLLGAHALVLAVASFLTVHGVLHSLGHSVPLAGLAMLASSKRIGRKLRAALASGGLVTASALIVHLTGGLIESHFHFFVMVAVITLYEDWIPFGLAFAYVVVHHGAVGALDATGVYNHGDAQAHPWRWAAIHGFFVIGAGAANVVTWRLNEDVRARIRETEQRASESEQRHAAIVESSDDAIISATPDGKITSWNLGAEQLFGYSTEEALGRAVTLIVPPELQKSETERILATVRTGRAVRDFETERLRKDGTRVPISLTVSPIKDSAGVTVGCSAIARDFTQQRAAAAERERVLEREREQVEHLRHLDRMKDEFIALVSHELRTPLTSIRGYLELVAEGDSGGLTAEQQHFLGVVGRNADRLQSLVGDLLFIAQMEAGRVELERGEVELAAVCEESVESSRPLAGIKEIELTLDAEQVTLVGDRCRLGQLVDNFVSNAIKFTPDGGRVRVRVWAQDGHAVIEVADNGMGIPTDEQERLFERFFRSSTATAQAIQGTGLGLTIARAIVEGHGGAITFTSVENEGTTFRIQLPLGLQLEEAA